MRGRTGLFAALIGLATLSTGKVQAAPHALVYRYIEAEASSRSTGVAFRNEGFTSWMGHPSGGRTVIFDTTPGAHVAYTPDGLPDEPLYLFVRQLAFPAPQASVEASAGDTTIGVTSFARPGTMLNWSNRLGPFRLAPGKSLTLRSARGSNQAPYLDVVLLTNDPEYVPDNVDQDFRSSVVEVGGESISIDRMEVGAIQGKCSVSFRVANGNSRSWKLDAVVALRADDAPREGVRRASLVAAPGVTVHRIPIGPCELRRTRVRLDVTGEGGKLLFSQPRVVQVLPPAEVVLNAVSFSAGETVRADVTLNDTDLLGTPRVGIMSISRPGARPVRVQARAKGAHLCLSLPARRLARGAYTLGVTVPGVPAARGSWRITRLDLPADRLPDIRKVEIRNQAILVNGRPFVPRKLYHAAGTPDVKAQGYNAVDCWGGDTLEGVEKTLDEAHANNLYGYGILFHPYFYKGMDKGFDLAAVERGVLRLRSHPALLLWELYDEPDAGVPVAHLQAAYDLVRRLDPNHPVLLNFCFPDKFAAYSTPCDIVSTDIYPVPYQPLTRVPEYLAKLDAAANHGKPLQIALQAYGDVKGRMPTPAELRCMTYLSIAAGARSFAYYSWAEGAGYPFCLTADHLLWSYTRELNAELMALREVIAAPNAPPPSCSQPAVRVAARRVGGRLVIIAANTLPKALPADIRVAGAPTGTATVLFEGRRLRLPLSTDGIRTIHDRFERYGVHLYCFGR